MTNHWSHLETGTKEMSNFFKPVTEGKERGIFFAFPVQRQTGPQGNQKTDEGELSLQSTAVNKEGMAALVK